MQILFGSYIIIDFGTLLLLGKRKGGQRHKIPTICGFLVLETLGNSGTMLSQYTKSVSSKMTKIPLPARVNISEQVLFQEIEGECVLLDIAAEQYFGLDDVGTRIWQLLVDKGDTAEVLAQLKLDYKVDESTLREDLAKLIEELRSEGLVRVESSESQF